ncbi:MAG: hypothetical protein WAN36_09165, partial [Calditrichia bacterium]
GGGYIRISQQEIDVSVLSEPVDNSFYFIVPPEKSDDVAAVAGGGITFKLSKQIQPFIQGNYFLGMTSSDDTIYYGVMAGFRLKFQ